MVSPLEVVPVLSGLYAAALDGALWPEALSSIRRAAGANGAQLMLANRGSPFSAGIDPGQNALYNEYYSRLDPVPARLAQLPAGAIMSCSQMLPEADRQSAFFHEWADPNQISDAVFLKLSKPGDTLCALALGHRYRETPFLDRSLGLFLDALAPHLVNAVEIARRLESTATQAAAAQKWLDGAGNGWLLVDHEARLLCANETAWTMIRANDGLCVRDGVLTIDDAALDQRFQKHVAAASRAFKAADFGRSIMVGRPSGAPPYAIRMMPHHEDAGLLPEKPGKVTLFISDAALEAQRLADVLQEQYGLTVAETRIALLVRKGEGLQKVASERCISLSTARVHLQHIFEKTGAHRQSELVALMAALRL